MFTPVNGSASHSMIKAIQALFYLLGILNTKQQRLPSLVPAPGLLDDTPFGNTDRLPAVAQVQSEPAGIKNRTRALRKSVRIFLRKLSKTVLY